MEKSALTIKETTKAFSFPEFAIRTLVMLSGTTQFVERMKAGLV